MTEFSPLIYVLLLDVSATWILSISLQHWSLCEPVLALWLTSLLRLGLLCALLQAFPQCALRLSAWLQWRDLYWMLAMSCLLTPVYVSLTMAAQVPSGELLYGSHNWSVLALNYVTTGLVFLFCQHFLPDQNSVDKAGSRGTLTRLLSYMKPDIGRFLLVAVFLVLSSLGDITSRVTTDTNTMSESLTEKLSLLMWYLMRAGCLLVFMVNLSFKLTLFTIIGTFIISIIPKYTGKYYQKLSAEVQESLANANDVAVETFSSMKTVRSFASEDGQARRYADRLEDTYRLNKKEAAAYAGFMWTNSLSDLVLKVSLLYCGGCLVATGNVTTGDLVSLIFYELQFTTAVEVLMSVYPNVKKAIGASEKVFEYMDRTPALSTVGTLAPDRLRGHIQFNNVTFAYPTRADTQVLKNVSFELKRGEITALVGPSGGGKTTCVALLERFYQPQSGEILLDGIPIEEYEHKYYHNKVALVSQEPVLFARSVETNIAYGLDGKPTQAVKRAAERADADRFISKLKDQYKTDAGEKGGQLSGGQKQRVAIARALIRDPQVLILDDATSCLDAESEHTVLRSVYDGDGDRAVLVIAHRLSTIERADWIVVLEGGIVVEQGTHEELRERGGCYQRLLRKHFQGFGKRMADEEIDEIEN
ncbi:antigen peptide transporter 1 isoform X2 [Carcharodon carcharias]|uniref:antigen peptide transporter 1 isoform X2 n=1 Tax=Carcharodon carcharias TaxID=13397 RepID=UPI001B7E4F88|nr:antigen peptide transporter 1 isoform X2 [Carcharodon carcharias]